MKPIKYISFGALALVIVALIAGSFLDGIYRHPLVMGLWGVAAVSGFIYLLGKGGFKRPFTFLLHVSFLFILAGALVTFLTGESGSLHLREGEESSGLPFGVRLETFEIEHYPGTDRPMDYRSSVTFLPEGKTVQISMNHIARYKGYRFYQADYDADGKGSVLTVSHDPWGIAITYTGYLLLLVSMLGFFFQKDTPFRAACARIRIPQSVKTVLSIAGGILFLGCCWLICRSWIFQPLVPVLRSPLLWIHVAGMILSYTVFALVAGIGIAGLVSRREDTPERLRDVSLMVLYPAVFLLTFGTFLGAVWANISWGNYWSWDPKETWALITLLVYSFALHGGALKPFRNARFFHAFLIAAFLCVLITYFGVNLFLGGMHSYA